jgi:DNA-binding transcriptional ArsR family regulator
MPNGSKARVYTMNGILEHEISQLQDEIGCGPADPTPIMILYELVNGPQNVAQLATALNINQLAMLSQLRVLRERRMVTANRVGATVQYRLADRRLIEALDSLRAVLRDTVAHRAEVITDFGEN